MRLPIKAVCDCRPRKDQLQPIGIQYCYSSEKRTVLPTNLTVPLRYWNRKQECISEKIPSTFGDATSMNEYLSVQLRRAEDLIKLGTRLKVNDPLQFVKERFPLSLSIEALELEWEHHKQSEQQNGRKNLDLFFQIDDYIKSQTGKVSRDMPRIYQNMKEHLLEYQAFLGEAITFDSLDFNFYEGLVDFLSYRYIQRRRKERIVGLKVNTVGKTIKQFRTFLRNRIRKRIIPPIDMDGWKILEEEVDAVYLPWNEIKLIQEVDLSQHKHLEDYRNDFVLGCLTGLRFSDFSRIDKNDVRGDLLYKKQEKSDRWVVIPLRTEAVEILRNRFEKGVPVPTNVEFNRHIKTIAKLAGLTKLIKHSYKKGNKDVVEVKPKYAWILSHTCRRSFCTNEFLAGTPVELIMKISGHKSVKDFYKYIRILEEEAAIRIKELWLKRSQMDVA